LLVALLLAGCSGDPPPGPEPSATAAASSTAASIAPSATAAPIDRSPVKTTEDKTRLPLIATKFDEEVLDEYRRMWFDQRALMLHPLRGTMAVSYGGYVLALKDNKLERWASIFPEEAYTFTMVGGRYPKPVVARVYFDSWASPGYQRSPPVKESQYYELGGTDWKHRAGDPGKKVAGWKGDSLLAIQSHGLAALGGDGKPPTQAPPRDAAGCKGATTELAIEDLDGLPSGEAFVIGKRCSTGAYAVEVWSAGATESTLEDLPDAPLGVTRALVTASAPDRAYAVLSGESGVYAARWDGRAFRKLEFTAERDALAAWAAADGTLFMVLALKSPTPKTAKAELVRVSISGEVAKSATFAPSPGAKVWAADAQTAYVASYGSILSTKPGLTFVVPKKDEKPTEAPKPPPLPEATMPPYTDACTTPFVWLYDVSSKAPTGYDFPTTRKALASFPGVADLALVEFVHGSVRRLGVKVASGAQGKALVEHVIANMKDESPSLVCLAPTESVRPIAIP
jgi:hypothetical protein